jgi:hypothetical protein
MEDKGREGREENKNQKLQYLLSWVGREPILLAQGCMEGQGVEERHHGSTPLIGTIKKFRSYCFIFWV